MNETLLSIVLGALCGVICCWLWSLAFLDRHTAPYRRLRRASSLDEIEPVADTGFGENMPRSVNVPLNLPS